MNRSVYDVCIIGAGAAGLMCAIQCSQKGLSVCLLEKKKEPGAKILMSGGGRCNVTNVNVTERDYSSSNPRVVRHILQTFPAKEVVSFFESLGVELKCEKDHQFFTADGRAQVVLSSLLSEIKRLGTQLITDSSVLNVLSIDNVFAIQTQQSVYKARHCVIATGGLSYPKTGSTGDGYNIAKQFGHIIIPTEAALTPFILNKKQFNFSQLQGLSCDVILRLWHQSKKVKEFFGGFLFTHFGVSGPVVLNISRYWVESRNKGDAKITVDFLPGLSDQNSIGDSGNKNWRNHFSSWLPERLVCILLEKAGVSADCTVHQLSKEQRKGLIKQFRQFDLPIEKVYGFEKAEVTSGGVDLNELKGASLESKFQQNLYFIGEVCDVDGRIGGFNFQWAWSSAAAATQGINKG